MGRMVAYRITARSLERQLVGEDVLKEFKSLEDCSGLEAQADVPAEVAGKVVFVLEEDDPRRPSGPRTP